MTRPSSCLLCAIGTACTLAVFATPARGEDADLLRRRVEELEKENRQLRQTSELQTQELLELRRKLKELESALPEPPAGDAAQVRLDSRRWNYTVGVMVFSVFDSGDAISRGYGPYTLDGMLTGYAFSAGKDRDRVGIMVYNGQYDYDSNISSSAGESGASRTTSDRLDVDLAWTHILLRNDRVGLGFLAGVKYLRSDKTVTHTEIKGAVRDEAVNEGLNEWMMGSGGLLLSSRLFRESGLSGFATFAVSVGAVRGMAVDVADTAWDDGSVDYTYRDDTQLAWGINGTLGLQYPVMSRGVVRVGYRSQALNSVDGFAPFVRTSTFYDGQQSVFAALDVLF